ncbi:RDD family protein [Paenibacillus lentus]|uniref:RDD family protein n=1 Tax=Paenibacillus lentus TaxID=1338368 RepID=UPI00365D4312
MYAGFWKRFVACILDSFIAYILGFSLTILEFLLNMLLGREMGSSTRDPGLFKTIIFFLRIPCYILIPWLYYAILESSKLQGTLGKKALGIVVVDQHYHRVSFGRASGRFWCKILSSVFFVGFIIAGFTEKKQALHDIIANTYVAKKKALELNKDQPPMYPHGVHMQGQQV